MRLITILCVLSALLAIFGGDIPGAIGQTMIYVAGLVAGAMLFVIAFAYREHKRELGERQDNPRCFCPDCGADLGNFYSNRIQMEGGRADRARWRKRA